VSIVGAARTNTDEQTRNSGQGNPLMQGLLFGLRGDSKTAGGGAYFVCMELT
jgi:hypothetical protein